MVNKIQEFYEDLKVNMQLAIVMAEECYYKFGVLSQV